MNISIIFAHSFLKPSKASIFYLTLRVGDKKLAKKLESIIFFFFHYFLKVLHNNNPKLLSSLLDAKTGDDEIRMTRTADHGMAAAAASMHAMQRFTVVAVVGGTIYLPRVVSRRWHCSPPETPAVMHLVLPQSRPPPGCWSSCVWRPAVPLTHCGD